MRFWFVIHDYSAHLLEPYLIGKEMRLEGKISKISKGDKILYYATGDMVVINSYDVTSNGFEFKSLHQKAPWNGIHWAYRIRSRMKGLKQPVPIKNIAESVKISLFPSKSFVPIRFKDRTVVEISKNEFYEIEYYMKRFKSPQNSLFQGAPNEGNLGEPVDLDILNYAPTSEQGVVVLFASFMKELPQSFVKMEFVRSGFPDACVIQRKGNLYSRRYVEFEFRASSFKEHIRKAQHNNIKCDYVVCWINDFHTCPIPVIELKSELFQIREKKNKKAA